MSAHGNQETGNIESVMPEVCVYHPQQRLHLMDLPDDILCQIAALLDMESIWSFADAHPRLRAVCKHAAPTKLIESLLVDGILHHFISLNPSRVRILDLSNCWSEPQWIEALISECRNVTELKVVNSSLNIQNILNVLEKLEELQDLSVSIRETVTKARFGCYPNVRNLHIEVNSVLRIIAASLRFLNACVGVRNLSMFVVNYDAGPDRFDRFALSEERWNSFQTIELSMKMVPSSLRDSLLTAIFSESLYTYFAQNMDDDGLASLERGTAEDEGREPRPRRHQRLSYEEFVVLEASDTPIGIRVIAPQNQIPLRMSPIPLFSLLELDLTRCHLLHTEESWASLMFSVSNLTALAIPLCFLSTAPDSLTSRFGSDLFMYISLTKLHVEVAPETDCANCRDHKLGDVLTWFIESQYQLEELTLNRVALERGFFSSLTAPWPLRTVKLIFEDGPHPKDLENFFRGCWALQGLKLEIDVSLNCILLWDALSAANLGQLCLKSTNREILDGSFLKTQVSRLLKNLSVLHLHTRTTRKNDGVIFSLQRKIQKENRSRGDDPIHFVWTKGRRASENHRVLCFPGRSICCTESFIAMREPIGWDC